MEWVLFAFGLGLMIIGGAVLAMALQERRSRRTSYDLFVRARRAIDSKE